MQKKRRKKRRAGQAGGKKRRAGQARGKLEPPPSPIISQRDHIDCGDDFAMLVPRVTDLATWSHVGFGSSDYVAKIASSRFPREKNRPRTPQSARVDDGISAPVQKIPPRSTSEPPPYRTTYSSSLTLPTRCLLGKSPRGCARTPENRRTGQKQRTIVSRQIDASTRQSNGRTAQEE